MKTISQACLIVAGLALAFACTPLHAQALPRRATLGAKLGPATGGVAILEVLPGATAQQLGITTGDIIVSIDGQPTDNPLAVVRAMEPLRGGDPIRIDYRRGGASRTVSGKAASRPFESYANATVKYGAYGFKGGAIRDILVMPAGKPDAPVVFFLQGYTCASIEAGDPFGLYGGLAKGFADAGIGFYRVEKPGMGDSRGGVRCEDIDYATELDAYRTAYRHLVQDLGISPDRIFLYGHSLGGLQAPMLAAENAPRGVAVYGTVLKDWAAYSNDLAIYQNFLINGADPAEEEAKYAMRAATLRHFYVDRWSPERIAAADPAAGQALREMVGWDGGAHAFGRSYVFAQDLPGLPLIKAWRDTKSNVLSLYGASDEVALFDTDQRMIAEVVNWYRPGTARFVSVLDTMHAMDLVGDRDAFRRRNMAAGGLKFGMFNPKVLEPIIAWIRDSMASPPVRVRSFASPVARPTAP
ncbi:MAG: PDZ domain-containing protein [Sphingomonas sp.]|nr:MAG: PDZ domain-containing protein [Sphingomonas sp.]